MQTLIPQIVDRYQAFLARPLAALAPPKSVYLTRAPESPPTSAEFTYSPIGNATVGNSTVYGFWQEPLSGYPSPR